MTKRARALAIGAVAALAVAAVAFVVVGQTGAASPRRGAFLEKVAAHLGVSVDALKGALEKAHLEMIDEAVAAGKLTPEQAEALKARLEARKALREVLDEAIASGKITEEQLGALRERLMGRAGRFPGRGIRGRIMERLMDRKCTCP
ncbi:MAG: YckD family protein [Candidatus Bipolaricaulota bacterium]|nr:YckD family protein [Candidatus Bipolaricaulota bacterium]